MDRWEAVQIQNLTRAVNDLLHRLREVERKANAAHQYLGVGGGGGFGSGTIVDIRCATTSGTISAKAAGVAGSGSVVCSDINPSSGAVTTAETLSVYNFFAVSIPTSTDVFIGWAPNLTLGGVQGVWVIIQRYCP